jgi:hypothetical protein
MNIKGFAAALAVASLAVAGAAHANTKAYMTGSSNPWGSTAEDSAMNTAFGAGNWDKFNGFNASVFSSGYSFVYLDGGDGISGEFDSFMGANLGALETFVSDGGHVMVNAARWTFTDTNTGNGTFLHLDNNYANASFNGYLTLDGILAGLAGGGAGTSWSGNYFAHDVVNGLDDCLVTGDNGCVFGSKGSNLYVGSQTSPIFQSGGGQQLRVNELRLAADVPEPAAWALMITGFGLAGATLRRRRQAIA